VISPSQSQDAAFIQNLTSSVKLHTSLDPDDQNPTIDQTLKFLISKTQENSRLAGVYQTKWDKQAGQVMSAYLHGQTEAGVGKLGSIFLLDAGSMTPALQQTAATLAMHAAAMKPSVTTVADLDEKTTTQTVEEA